MDKDRANTLAFEIYMNDCKPMEIMTEAEREEVHVIMRRNKGWTFHDCLLQLC